jgi:hypothetical protein
MSRKKKKYTQVPDKLILVYKIETKSLNKNMKKSGSPIWTKITYSPTSDTHHMCMYTYISNTAQTEGRR